MGESIESGPLSDVQSEEDEGRRSSDCHLQLTAPLADGRGRVSLVQQLLEDIQSQDKDPDIWKKIEVWTVFVCLSVRPVSLYFLILIQTASPPLSLPSKTMSVFIRTLSSDANHELQC